MKNIVRFLPLALVLVMTVAAFAACGDKGGNDTKDSGTAAPDSKTADTEKGAEVAGEKQTWGQFTVLVPSNMTLKGGDLLNADDTSKFGLSETDNAMRYINVSIVDEEDAADNVATTKEVNSDSNPVDVELTTGDTTWKGITYNSLGYDCTSMYGIVDGQCVFVMSTYIYDSDTMKSVLGSIEVAPAE